MQAVSDKSLSGLARAVRGLARDYRARHGLPLLLVNADGQPAIPASRVCPDRQADELPLLCRVRREGLEEAVRWGEPFTFFLLPGILSWMIPLVDGSRVLGGLAGGQVAAEALRPADDPAIGALVEGGLARDAAHRFLAGLPLAREVNARAAADYLFSEIYRRTRLRPTLLEQNRENARQQREIGEEIHRLKARGGPGHALAEERALLELMRVGDRAGAMRELNRQLAWVFLDSVRIPLIQARLIEMIGYLVRLAVENNPMLEPLVARHHGWLVRILATTEFEDLCRVLRDVLHDFMDAVSLQGYNSSNTAVQKALDYLDRHYTGPVRLEAVARAGGCSVSRIAHLMKEVTGKSTLQHLKRLRVQRARRLLVDTDKSYADIGYALGFTDQSHFIRHFRELTGTTPARFRRNWRAAPAQAGASA